MTTFNYKIASDHYDPSEISKLEGIYAQPFFLRNNY